ncbi:MAG TPA: alpha/beta fold hydrolase, partial [Thermoanaerobaculia bacterium]|nr:alpha/beta fold hydrolase [Thermoanaerobaculia bacterium]
MLERALLVSLALLLLPLAAKAGEPVTGFVDVPGGKLWYEVRGQGSAMVFLHDGLLASETWDDQIPVFEKTFRTVRYDRRGYGRSEPAKAPYSDVDDLAAVFDALKIPRAILVGCSYGGSLAVDFALAHPDRVEGLVLTGPVVSGLPYSQHFNRRGIVNALPRFREGNTQKVVENWANDPYITDAASTRARERIRELLTKNPGPVSGNLQPTPPARPAASRLGEIRKPALLLLGASDIPDVHAHAGALENGIERARRVVIPGAGHLVHMEKPELWNEIVLEFASPGTVAAAYLKTLEGDRTREQSRNLFDYDSKGPLDVQEAGTETRGNVQVVDLTYASPLGGRVPAFLVLPPGTGKHPAVLFLHPGQGNRSTFLDEAVELAKDRGFVSLSISAPFLRPEAARGKIFDAGHDRKEQIQTIVDLRRGLDLLVSRPEVDPTRLAYVGHSLGATVGGTLAGIETRPLAYVLMAGLPSLSRANSHGDNRVATAFQTLLTPEEQKAYVDALSPIDAVHYVGHATPAKL